MSCRRLPYGILPLFDLVQRGVGGQNGAGADELASWQELRPRIVVKDPNPGAALKILGEEPGLGWQGEALVPLEGAWSGFRFRMAQPGK